MDKLSGKNLQSGLCRGAAGFGWFLNGAVSPSIHIRDSEQFAELVVSLRPVSALYCLLKREVLPLYCWTSSAVTIVASSKGMQIHISERSVLCD